ncbi:hypothetical protein O181_054717 [Austropuccinia psidii MF-1]|uniref:Integrase catalytic domain-containing protein n=1 Tax=Austropuccinia psidii MF-1 TaxID=1389203 RepID=A0A9Q3E7G2_9BASI|nr:hypothetical protein [Austropuccinia psidii MF-1]
MIKIQETSRPWEIFYMDWVTGLPPVGDISYSSLLVVVDRFSKTSIFLPSHHPQTDSLAEGMIQKLEDIVRNVFAYCLELKDCDGVTHYWCTLLASLELAYKASFHSSTNQTPAILEKGWNARLPQDSLRNIFFGINPTADSFTGMLEKARKNAVIFMED